VQKCVETPPFLGTHFPRFRYFFVSSPSSPDASREVFQPIQVASRAVRAGRGIHIINRYITIALYIVRVISYTYFLPRALCLALLPPASPLFSPLLPSPQSLAPKLVAIPESV
jgi:hypothetical protein